MTNDKTMIEKVALAIIIARDGVKDGTRRFQDPIIKQAYINDAIAALSVMPKHLSEEEAEVKLESIGMTHDHYLVTVPRGSYPIISALIKAQEGK
jgi:hypothetical protein